MLVADLLPHLHTINVIPRVRPSGDEPNLPVAHRQPVPIRSVHRAFIPPLFAFDIFVVVYIVSVSDRGNTGDCIFTVCRNVVAICDIRLSSSRDNKRRDFASVKLLTLIVVASDIEILPHDMRLDIFPANSRNSVNITAEICYRQSKISALPILESTKETSIDIATVIAALFLFIPIQNLEILAADKSQPVMLVFIWILRLCCFFLGIVTAQLIRNTENPRRINGDAIFAHFKM